MALALDQLVFSVDSTQLDEARIKIAKLGDAVAALNKPLQEMSRSSAKTNEVIAKSELAAEKARTATKALADTTGQVKDKVDPLAKLIEKLSNNYTDMASGFTKGESSILNQARNLGIFGSELQPVIALLEKIKTLNKDPFDASLGGVRSITQEFEKLQQRANLAAQGIMLTTKQLGEYSKLAAEAAGKVEGMGFDPKSGEGLNKYNQLLAESQNKYLEIVGSVNKLTQAEKDRNEALKQQERLLASNKAISDAMIREVAGQVGQKSPELKQMAEFYKKQEIAARQLTAAEDDLILREQKLAFVNKELAAGLSTASANALFKYQKDLEALGKSADEVSQRMSSFRAGLVERQSHSQFTKLTQDVENTSKRLDHLSRALGPQITDIFVGLATGQSLLTVALQQGGQIRDQIALAGVASSDMGTALSTAAVKMVGSLKDVAVAMSSLLITPFIAAGKAMTDFGLAAVGATEKYKLLRVQMAMSEDAGSKLATTTYRILGAIPALVGSVLGAIAVAVIAVTAAMIKNQAQMDDLTRSLVLTGGSMDLTARQALVMAESMNEAGIGTSKALIAMTAMAKQGGFVTSEIEMVTKSAVDLQKYGGVAIEDTIKSFAKMREKPVEALIEIGKSTGFVSLETIKLVKSLEEQGKYAEATTVAMKAKADADEEAVNRLKRELTPLALLWIDIKELVGQATTAIYNFANSSSSVAGFRTVFETVSVIIAEVWYTISQVGNEIGGIAAQITAIVGGLSRGDVFGGFREASSIHDMMQKDAVAARQSQDELVASIMNRNKVQAEGVTISNSEAAANSKAISEYMRATKQREEAARKAKKDAEDLAKEREKDIESYKDLMNVYTGYTKTYNNQVESLKRLLSSKEISPEKFTEAMFALEQLQPYFKKSEDAFIAYNEEIEKHSKVVKDLQDINSVEASSLEHRTSLLGKTANEQRLLTIEYEKQQKLLKLDIQYKKELTDLEARGFDGEYGANKRAELDKQFEDARVLIAKDANLKIAEDYQKQFEAIQKELGDVMFLALTNRGAQAGKKLRDLIKAELMKPITLVVNAVVNTLLGQVSGTLGLPSGSAGSALSVASNLSGLTGIGSAFGTAFGSAAMSTLGLGGSSAAMTTSLANAGYWSGGAAATSASSLGASIGAYAPYALAAVVALDQLGILDRWSGDPDAFLVQQATGVNQQFASSTQSRLGTVGFVNGSATIMRNGRLISEYGETEGITTSAQRAALDVITALDNAVADTLSQSQIVEISKNLSGWFQKSWSVESGTIENFIASRYETILGTLDSSFGKLKDYQKEGEKLSDTAVRLITTFTTVKTVFENIGVSIDGLTYKAANDFATVFGGVDKLGSSLSKFYDTFYTEAEKTVNLAKNTTEAFNALGLALPSSRDAFKELVKSTINAGDPQLLASLLGLQDAFTTLTEPVEELKNKFKELSDSLLEEVDRLRGAVISDVSLSGGIPGLTAEFAMLTAQAKLGNTTALEKLPEYSQAIEQAVAASAVNASDVAYARAWLAESLGNTNAVLTGTSPSIVSSSLTQDVAGTTTVNGATAIVASSSSQSDLIAALIAEVQGLRAEVRADVSANSKTAKILERANQDGETLSVSVV